MVAWRLQSAELTENRGDKLIQMLGERRIDPKTQKNSYQNSFFLFVGISILAKQLQNFILRAFFAGLDRISNIMIILRHIFNHAMTQLQSHYTMTHFRSHFQLTSNTGNEIPIPFRIQLVWLSVHKCHLQARGVFPAHYPHASLMWQLEQHSLL